MLIAYKDNTDGFYQCSVASESDIPAWAQGMTRLTDNEVSAVINSPEKVKERTNASIQAQISALEAQIPPLMRHFVVRPNAPMSRPSGPPKTPAQVIADIDSQIEALKATLIP